MVHVTLLIYYKRKHFTLMFFIVFWIEYCVYNLTKWHNQVQTCTNIIYRIHSLHFFSRGYDSAQRNSFTEWFARIGELRSLSLIMPVLALTATASLTNRKKRSLKIFALDRTMLSVWTTLIMKI